MKRIALLLTTLLIAFPAVGQAPVDALTIDEWDVPWEQTRPRDPYVDHQGRVWFVGQQGNYIAYLTPDSGEFKRYEIIDGTHPHNLIVDETGRVWYAGNRNAHIGALDPETGEIVRYDMPDEAARDPHTLAFGKGSSIWFTTQGGNFVGRLDRTSGEVELIPVPTPRARPYGIKVDSNGRPWIALFGTNKIATVDPAAMTLEEIELPRSDARPRRLEVTSDGAIWYVDYPGGMLGRLDPESRSVQEWALPSGEEARPYGTAMDSNDRIWIAESGPDPNRIVGFDTASKRFLDGANVPSGGGTLRHMYYHEPSATVWFGADTNTIGRARLPQIPQ